MDLAESEALHMDAIMSIHRLTVGYERRLVLLDINLDVERHQLLHISGGNASGKSTLLKAMFGLLPFGSPESEIIFRPDHSRQNFSTTPAWRNLQNGLVYVPQANSVFEDLSVEENLDLAVTAARNNRPAIRWRDEVLHALPSIQSLLPKKAAVLSGGERRLVALARALLARGKLVLLDEPLAGLDEVRTAEVESVLAKMLSRDGSTIVIVEHRIFGGRLGKAREIHLADGMIQPSGIKPEMAVLEVP